MISNVSFTGYGMPYNATISALLDASADVNHRSGQSSVVPSEVYRRELEQLNQRLVEESELLRLALAETDSLRQRESAVLRERTILFDSLTVLSNARSTSTALHELLVSLRALYQACPVCLLVATDNEVRVHASANELHLGMKIPLKLESLSQPRRMASLLPLASSTLPDDFQALRSLVMVPLPLAGVSQQSALLLGAQKSGRFTASDLKVVERISALAQPILAGLYEAEEREHLQRELQVAQRREMIGQVAAGLAHDFNNLLAAIGGNASLIDSDVPAESAAATGVRRIEAAVEQAGGLVRRLLALGAKQPERSLVDLNTPFRQAADLLQANLRPPLTLEVLFGEASFDVLANPTDIMQLLLNLGINARDAMQEEDNQGVITLSLDVATRDDLLGECIIGHADPERRYMALKVKDQGPGIPHDKLSQLFKRYVTTKGDQGSGLGLSIVASIVTANQAALKVFSAPGEGCEFIILWPEKGAEDIEKRPSSTHLTGNLAGRSLLVVDDQPSVLTVITEMLEAAGAEVAPTDTPDDVIDALKDDPDAWDMVITDFDMPTMNGDELAREVRKLVPGLPVMAITALATIRLNSPSAFDECIEKPVNNSLLIDAVERLITHGTLGDDSHAHSDR